MGGNKGVRMNFKQPGENNVCDFSESAYSAIKTFQSHGNGEDVNCRTVTKLPDEIYVCAFSGDGGGHVVFMGTRRMPLTKNLINELNAFAADLIN